MIWLGKMKNLLINIMFFIFLFIVMIAHPSLVARIISQVETPFVTRIGLVIITYPILFPIFLFFSKTLNEPKKDEESSDGGEGCAYILYILFLLMPAIFVGFGAWQELQLRHQLLQEGDSGVATVQRCKENESSRGSSCYVSYHYEVPLANTTKLYTVTEPISCARVCNIGSSVDITYLPQTPAEARILGDRYSLRREVLMPFFLLNGAIFLITLTDFWDYLMKKWKHRLKREDDL